MLAVRKDVASWCAGISALMILLPPIKEIIAANLSISTHKYGLLFALQPREEVNIAVLTAQIAFVWFAGICLSLVAANKADAAYVKPERIVAKNANDWVWATALNFWNGAEPLWKAYWLVGVLGSAVWTLIVRHSETITNPNILQKALPYFSIPYALWATVSIWRCANNASQPMWKFLARGIVAFSTAAAIAGLLNQAS